MKWLLPTPDPSATAQLAADLGLALPAARVLWNRGYRTPEAARKFFAPTLADLHDPYLLKDMDRAVPRLKAAITNKEKILLYGDYDVDGTSSVVVLKKGIELLGGTVDFHVPHRLRDGYGMRSEVVEEAATHGITLIVSVDTGIRANAVVEHAATLNIDVIVTDHHLPEAALPPAVAVLNPNRADDTYPEKNLCGAGVALKLIDALITAFNWTPEKRERLIDSFLKLVAIATVADVVPLTGENRVIVKRGLSGLDQVRNPGLRALLDISGFPPGKTPSAREIAFQVAPRINAAGRMASASDVIEMFLTSDPDRARDLASQLHELNKDRRQTEQEIAQSIIKLCLDTPVTDKEHALVFAGEGWHRGVVGIVASRVVERFHRPVFVLGIENGTAQGSGRSISAFHLLEALEHVALEPVDLTMEGGLKAARGFIHAISRFDPQIEHSINEVDTATSRFGLQTEQPPDPTNLQPSQPAPAPTAITAVLLEATTSAFILSPGPQSPTVAEPINPAAEENIMAMGSATAPCIATNSGLALPPAQDGSAQKISANSESTEPVRSSTVGPHPSAASESPSPSANGDSGDQRQPERASPAGLQSPTAGPTSIPAASTPTTLFTKFGGHHQAAGLTMPAEHVPLFRQRLQAFAQTRLTPADFEREIEIDAEITLAELTKACERNDPTIEQILSLAPFGAGNPPPVFVLRNVELAAPPDIRNEKHVFVQIKCESGRPLRAKAWNFADRAPEFTPTTPTGESLKVDLIIQFEDDAYSAARGYAPWQTTIRDVRRTQAASAANSQ